MHIRSPPRPRTLPTRTVTAAACAVAATATSHCCRRHLSPSLPPSLTTIHTKCGVVCGVCVRALWQNSTTHTASLCRTSALKLLSVRSATGLLLLYSACATLATPSNTAAVRDARPKSLIALLPPPQPLLCNSRCVQSESGQDSATNHFWALAVDGCASTSPPPAPWQLRRHVASTPLARPPPPQAPSLLRAFDAATACRPLPAARRPPRLPRLRLCACACGAVQNVLPLCCVMTCSHA